MARSKKAFVVSAAVAVTALGAAVGVSSLASADPTATTTPRPSGGPSAGTPDSTLSATTGDHGHGHGIRGEQFTEDLAIKLGLAQDEVATALDEIREENQPTSDPSQRPDRAERDAALAKALAEKLNVDEAKVKAALDELRSERQAARAAALKERLDAAVKAGTLTQAEADAVQKAVDKGVIHADR